MKTKEKRKNSCTNMKIFKDQTKKYKTQKKQQKHTQLSTVKH